MRRTSILLGTIAAPALLASAATAQIVITDLAELEDDDVIVQPYNLTADEIEDMDVIGAEGEQIGDVEDILVDPSGEVVALVVETEGFLGIGDEDVVLMLDQVELVGDEFVTSLTAEQLEEMPEWDD